MIRMIVHNYKLFTITDWSKQITR